MIRTTGALALWATVALTACSGSGEAALAPAPVFALDRDVTAGIAEVDPDRTDVLAAADLRLTLQELLVEHVAVLSDAMRAAVDDAPHLDALLDAITANTDALTVTLGVAYGPVGARAFDQLWTNHIEFFVRYARATGAGDETEAATALAQLGDYALDFSSFCDLATGGGAPAEAVAELLHQHVDQLRAQTEAWDDGDRDTADRLVWEAEQHAGVIAAALAEAIATQQAEAFPGAATGPAADPAAARQLLIVAVLSGSVSAATSPTDGGRAVLQELAAELDRTTGSDEWSVLAAELSARTTAGADPLATAERLDDQLALSDVSTVRRYVDAFVAAGAGEDPVTLSAARPGLHDLAVGIAAALG